MAGISTLLSALMVLLLGIFRLSSATVVVTGVSGVAGGVYPNGSRPFRHEISTFQNSGPAFDLFVLAFRAFELVEQSNVQSYYQVAGKPFYRSLVNHRVTNCYSIRCPWLSVQGMGWR
jgi:tyrosinase